MIDTTTIKSLASRLSEQLQNSSQDQKGFFLDTKDELEQSIHIFLESSLRKLNVVSREEFDAQTAVLQRTRAQLDSLEKTLSSLQQKISMPHANE